MSFKRLYIILISCSVAISLFGCSNKEIVIEDNSEKNKKSYSEILVDEGVLDNIVDFDKEFCVGYIGNNDILVNNFDTNILQKVDIHSGDREDIIDLIDDDKRVMCSWRYKDGWFVWSEDSEKELVIGKSKGTGWKIKAVNINQKSVIEIDGEKNNLPKERSFFATPINFSVDSNGVAYKGYYGLKGEVYERIMYFDFDTNRHIILDESIYRENNKEVLDTPFVATNKVYWGKYVCKEQYLEGTIYEYNINKNEKNKINREMLFEPIANDKYLIALEKEKNDTINGKFIIMNKEWEEIKIISNEIYEEKAKPSELVEPQLSSNYLVWRNVKETQLDIYDIENDILYNVFSPASGRFVVTINTFNNNFLQWTEMSAQGDITYKYAILK